MHLVFLLEPVEKPRTLRSRRCFDHELLFVGGQLRPRHIETKLLASWRRASVQRAPCGNAGLLHGSIAFWLIDF